MDNIKRFDTISEYNVFNNIQTLHPLVNSIYRLVTLAT
jgi:hypothetical protein